MADISETVLNSFSVVDLFTAGLGFELAGGFLLLRSSLARPHSIFRDLILGPALREAVEPVAGTVPIEADVDVKVRVQQVVEAVMGFGLLMAGFITQLIGYLLSTSLATTPAASSSHWGRGVAAVLVGFVVAGLLVVLARPLSDYATRMTVGRVLAHTGYPGDGGYGFLNLYRCALMFKEPRESESKEEFTRRVFAVPQDWTWPVPGHLPALDPEPRHPTELERIAEWLRLQATTSAGDRSRRGARVEAAVYRRLAATAVGGRFTSAEQFYLDVDAEHVQNTDDATSGVWANEAGARAIAAAREFADRLRSGES